MTKKRSSEIVADKNRKFFLEKVKLGKFSADSENFFGNREGNLKQGRMHHCLWGMDTSDPTLRLSYIPPIVLIVHSTLCPPFTHPLVHSQPLDDDDVVVEQTTIFGAQIEPTKNEGRLDIIPSAVFLLPSFPPNPDLSFSFFFIPMRSSHPSPFHFSFLSFLPILHLSLLPPFPSNPSPLVHSSLFHFIPILLLSFMVSEIND